MFTKDGKSKPKKRKRRTAVEGGQAHRDRQAAKSREYTQAVADIGDVPEVSDPVLKKACRLNLLKFLTSHFPESTGLYPFSKDHKKAISIIQYCALNGGRFVDAVYRGFAKTTIAENATIWMTMYGHRHYVPIFGVGQSAATDNIDSIKTELEENDILYQQFPEVCHAIRSLDGKPQRCGSQTHNGKLTHIRWTSDQIVLPTLWLPESQITGQGESGKIVKTPAGGGIIRAKGLMQASRGLKKKMPDGTNIRPDFIFIDDPQTDEVAASPEQVRKLRRIIKKSLLQSTGHHSTVAVVMNATVIEKGDLIETFLDHEQEPSWQGVRIPMVVSWSAVNDTMWLDKYAGIRNLYDPEDPSSQDRAHAAATEYYRKHRKPMDKGCVVSWEHCYDHERELSAIQHAYNALIDDGPDVFASEYQLQPLVDAAGEHDLAKKDLASRVNGYNRGMLPLDTQGVVSFIDIQGRLLYYSVIAYGEGFTPHLIDYGTWPKQKTRTYTAATAKNTYAMAKPGAGFEGQLYNALEKLTGKLLEKTWQREDGAGMQIALCLIDANWGKSTDLVYQFCRQSPHTARLIPSHGKYYGAKGQPFNEIKKQKGEEVGLHWRMPNVRGRRQVRYMVIDVNFWKTFTSVRLKTAMGDLGAMTFFGKRGGGGVEHDMLLDQLVSERCTEVEANERKVDEWDLPNHHADNHWWDCVVGCMVACSKLGARLAGSVHQAHTTKPKRKSVSLASARRNR